MSFTDYTGLVAEVGDWLDRADLTASIPGFIRLCESRLDRLLHVPAMETRVTLTTLTDQVGLPQDFKRMLSIYIPGTPNRVLHSISANSIPQDYTGASGTPEAYAIIGPWLYLTPPPPPPVYESIYLPPPIDATVQVLASDPLSLVMTYYAKLTPLSSTSNNWLMVRHPDAYFYGTLLAAEAYLTNDARLPIWAQAFDNVIEEIRSEGILDRYGVGIRMRSPVANLRGCRT